MDTIYDTVIVGAGPAGMTAAIYAVRANMKVLLLDRLSPGGLIVNTNEIENYPGTGKLSGVELAINMFEQTQELGVHFDYKTVKSIEDKGNVKHVSCEEDDAVFITRSVIIATGTVPRKLHVPGEEKFTGNGVSWCAICDGAQYRGKDVVVIGGGNSAVEEALYLAEICNKVTIVTMLDLTADPKAVTRLQNYPNVDIFTFQEILAFTGTKKLAGIHFKSTKDDHKEYRIPCDGIFEYIGFHASSEAFDNLGITDKFGCIATDASMRTSIPGVLGAGDITSKFLRQVVTAVSDGAIAANSAAAYVSSLVEE